MSDKTKIMIRAGLYVRSGLRNIHNEMFFSFTKNIDHAMTVYRGSALEKEITDELIKQGIL